MLSTKQLIINSTILATGIAIGYVWFARRAFVNESILQMALAIQMHEMVERKDYFNLDHAAMRQARAALRVYDRNTSSFIGKMVTPRASGFSLEVEGRYLNGARELVKKIENSESQANH